MSYSKINSSEILVTGGTGGIGKFLVNKLGNPKVISLSKGHNICNWENIKNLANYKLIIHLAALTFIPNAFEKPRLIYKTNVDGTNNILELCRVNDAKLIFLSSYIYGQPKYLPIDENHPINPNNPYSRSKAIAEQLCKSYYEDYGLRTIILRPFNVYGPEQNKSFLIQEIFNKIISNSKVELKNPSPKRDYVYIRDLINAILLAIRFNKSKFEIFNIGYGKSYSVEEVMKIINSKLKSKVEVTFLNKKRKSEIPDCYADITKARKLLNWEPKYDLDSGINEIVKHYNL